jgi:hypothetical protein
MILKVERAVLPSFEALARKSGFSWKLIELRGLFASLDACPGRQAKGPKAERSWGPPGRLTPVPEKERSSSSSTSPPPLSIRRHNTAGPLRPLLAFSVEGGPIHGVRLRPAQSARPAPPLLRPSHARARWGDGQARARGCSPRRRRSPSRWRSPSRRWPCPPPSLGPCSVGRPVLCPSRPRPREDTAELAQPEVAPSAAWEEDEEWRFFFPDSYFQLYRYMLYMCCIFLKKFVFPILIFWKWKITNIKIFQKLLCDVWKSGRKQTERSSRRCVDIPSTRAILEPTQTFSTPFPSYKILEIPVQIAPLRELVSKAWMV